MLIRYIKYAGLLLILSGLWACGNSNVSAPPDATITISPSSTSINVGDENWHTTDFTISVMDSYSHPIRDAKLSISLTWAAPDTAGFLQLYDGTTPKNSPFDAYTDRFGVYHLRVDYRAPCISGSPAAYNSTLEARSGAVYASATLDVTGAATCP